MQKELKQLMGYRKSIRVLDATLRDGGLVNNFEFTPEFTKALYETNKRAGVDYMEFGYRASKEMFNVADHGPWKFASDDDIRAVVGDNVGGPKISIMADVGRCDFRTDIVKKSESPVDMIRVACYLHQIPGAQEMIEYCKEQGYEVTCNIMAISHAQESDLKEALDLIGQSSVDVIYIVDSYGALYPEEMTRVVDIYRESSEKYGKELGIHAHNNQQLAFANTIECIGDGVNYLDATYNSMGRGAGNCAMELLLGFLKNPKYREYDALKFVQDYMVPLKQQGVTWGYDLQYLITGLLDQHPRSAIQFTKEKRTDYAIFYRDILSVD
ncbi:MAG: aldolase catalytic domain-containing protein [Clostridiales bacterium]|nr:aldolase catalytic domain-containing protein [Candidatus Blautia equi]